MNIVHVFLVANSGFHISQVCGTPNSGGFLVSPGAELTIINIHICIFFHKGSSFEKPGFGILNEPVSGLKMVNDVNGTYTIWSAISRSLALQFIAALYSVQGGEAMMTSK